MFLASVSDSFQNVILTSNSGLLANSLSLGHDIFVTIFVTMVIIGLCKCAIAQDFSMFWWNMGSLLFKMIGPLTALNFSQLILPQIQSVTAYFSNRIIGGTSGNVESLSQLSSDISKALFHFANAPFTTTSPFLSITSLNPANIPSVMVNNVIAWLVSTVVSLSFAWVGVELVLAWYQVIIGSSIGAASVGFFGSEETSDMAFRYTSGVISGMWKVVFLTVWPSTVVNIFNKFTYLQDLATPQGYAKATVDIMVFALIVATATIRIARMAENLFSGQAAFTASDIGRTVTSAVKKAINTIKKK